MSPGGNGEGKKSPLRRLPTDHRESLTQTGLRLASRRGTVVVVVVGRGISESELPIAFSVYFVIDLHELTSRAT